MAFQHGVNVLESSTPLSMPRTSGTVQVVVGTAPVNMLADPESAVNKPIYAASITEAMEQLGYCPDWRFTLCQSMNINSNVIPVKPIILINVLDPKKHNKTFDEIIVPVDTLEATVDKTGVLLTGLTVKTVGEDAAVLTAGTDYIAQYDAQGRLVISLIIGGAGEDATSLSVAGKEIDPDAVTKLDIIGGYDPITGQETGLEVIRQIYPKFGVVPSIIMAPGYSSIPEVGIALAAKAASINGVFKGWAILDLDDTETTKYTDCKTAKEKSGFNSTFSTSIWPHHMVGENIFAASAIAGAATAYTDAQNGDVPLRSPSNIPIGITGTCLADGTEVLLDQDQASLLNSYGIMTAINVNGYRLWGNYTNAYPSSTDAKDVWIPVRRMFNWEANNFILTYMSKVDDPFNVRLIEDIVNTENMRCAALVPEAWAAASIEYLADDNPTTAILDGHLIIRIHIAPYPPAQAITSIIDYDIYALTNAMNAAAA